MVDRSLQQVNNFEVHLWLRDQERNTVGTIHILEKTIKSLVAIPAWIRDFPSPNFETLGTQRS